MSKPPRLVVDAHDEWKVRASFPNGRYRFSLRASAVTLLRDELGYRETDIVPWQLFRILVLTGDAWLPDTSGEVEIADDLSRPDRAIALPEGDAKTLADYLRGKRFSASVREALATDIRATALDRFISPSELQQQEEWVEKTSKLLEVGETNQTESTVEPATATTSILHVGRVTLGRRNMGCAERIPDDRDAFEQAIDIAIERDVAAVVQTGGLFQSRSPSQEVVRDCREQLARLASADIPCYVVFGRQEIEAKKDHVDQFCDDELLRPLGGRAVPSRTKSSSMVSTGPTPTWTTNRLTQATRRLSSPLSARQMQPRPIAICSMLSTCRRRDPPISTSVGDAPSQHGRNEMACQ